MEGQGKIELKEVPNPVIEEPIDAVKKTSELLPRYIPGHVAWRDSFL